MNEEDTKLLWSEMARVEQLKADSCFKPIEIMLGGEIVKPMCPKCETIDVLVLNPKEYTKCDIRSIMEETGYCFHCAFWENLYQKNKDNPNWVIIDGYSWILGDIKKQDKRSPLLGCGGSIMIAKKNDGTILEDRNWWGQGNIPPHFRNKIPDNTIWIKDLKL